MYTDILQVHDVSLNLEYLVASNLTCDNNNVFLYMGLNLYNAGF